MKSKSGFWIAILFVFLLGAALPLTVMWNPARWQWAERLAGRIHNSSSLPQPQQAASATNAASQSQPGERKIKYWRAPMDPSFISDQPGKSPMGMDLIPVYEEDSPPVTGIRVNPNFLQNFAVRTAVVEKGSIPVDIRTIGILTYNEKGIVSVNTKFEGWIEKAAVNYIGEPVRQGDLLFEIYSPQLVTTQQEYLAAIDYLERLSSGGHPDAVARARSLLEAARERLLYWDITEEQIQELTKSARAARTLQIFSPVSGVVVEKMNQSLEGMKVTSGMNVYRIADLSTVWAEIEVFEHQIQFLRLGQTAQIAVDAFPGRRWSGKIIYIDPTVNAQTRTLKAHVEIPNADRKLRPGMYANIAIRVPTVSGALKVPEEAILRTGERSVVIVAKGQGVFEPREVHLGAMGGGYREVRRGLSADEIVVVSSQFLIDSESSMKEAISKMLGAETEEAEPEAEPSAVSHPR